MPRVLIVEDQPAVAHALRVLLEIHDFDCVTARDPARALALLAASQLDLVIQDMNFSPGATSGSEGVELFRRLRQHDPHLPVLVVTAWTSLETAVQMVKEGASDYLAKPWDDDKLLASVRNLTHMRALQRENDRLRAEKDQARAELMAGYDLRGIVYASAAMHRVVSLAAQVAAADVPVLITGPNGVGKERLADIIQANSRRKAAAFVKVNAGALPDELLESELFGAEPGAFTGATKRRIGRFEAADGGTLFLDEIGNLSAAGQTKLLRVLQSGEFQRLGSSETRRVDVRVLAATNEDLREAMARGRFRQDLFFRLAVIELAVPALMQRRDDVLPLADALLQEVESLSAARTHTLGAAARVALLEHGWPGNVRELTNRIQRAILTAPGPVLTPEDLGLGPSADTSPSAVSFDDDQERARLEEVLRETAGEVSKAARQLGLSRQALYRRMDKHGIVLERRPRS
jgi:DNA-binding NtrC family response regulator